MRREWRKENGSGEEEEVEFNFINEGAEEEVVVGEEEAASSSSSSPSSSKVHKKAKKVFPNLNSLVAASEASKAEALTKEKLEKESSKAALKMKSMEPTEEEKKNYVAIDCEMVGVGSSGKQSALARVSITDYNDECILDVFVRVDEKVTDFRTHVSGIRPKDIKSSDTLSIDQVRQKVFELTDKKFLIGHALKNDFKALLMTHPKNLIRDTACYPPYMRASGRGGGKLKPRKLRDLTKEFLNIDIQVAGESHDSIDDAKSAMGLYRRARGPWERLMKEKGAKRKKKEGSADFRDDAAVDED